MSEQDWNVGFTKSLGMYLNGSKLPGVNSKDDPISDDTFYLVFNTHHNPLGRILPPEHCGRRWVQVLDTHDSVSRRRAKNYRAGEAVRVEGRSLILLRRLD